VSGYTTHWSFVVDKDQMAPALSGIQSQLKATDNAVAHSGANMRRELAAARKSGMQLGDGLQEVASRIHPALGGVVGQLRDMAGAFKLGYTGGGMNAITSQLGHLRTGARGAGGSIADMRGALMAVAPEAEAAAGGMGSAASSMAMMGGPEGAAAVAVIAAIVGTLSMATLKAADFGHKFRELSNLNLDKADAEIGRLNDKVLSISFDKGIDAKAMSQGFFDLQSITGRYGKEVEDISGMVADFSKSYIVDFNEQLANTGQAMKSFGFGADGVDKFLQSTVKTVQTGKTTFAQLAAVRSEYFDAAAGSGFGYEDADKLFAAYSLGAKSVDIAAGQVKESLRSITDNEVVKKLKVLGVNVFDPVTGKIREMQGIVGDMVGAFGKGRMNDSIFADIKSQIGGGDGIGMLLDKARGQGEGFIDVFRQFDSAPVNMRKALAGANGDLMTMWETTKNKLGVSLIQIGQQILPTVVQALGFANDVLQELRGNTDGMGAGVKAAAMAFKWMGGVVWWTFTEIKLAIDAALAPIYGVIELAKGIGSVFEGQWNIATGHDPEAAGREASGRRQRMAAQLPGARSELAAQVSGMKGTAAYKAGDAGAVLDQLIASNKGVADAVRANGSAGRDMALEEVRRLLPAAKAAPAGATGMAKATDWASYDKAPDLTPSKGHKGGAGTSLGGESVTAGRGIRNVYVNIGKLIETQEIHVQAAAQGVEQAATMAVDTLVRELRNAEAMLGE
jgi:Phage-related minor tail protein